MLRSSQALVDSSARAVAGTNRAARQQVSHGFRRDTRDGSVEVMSGLLSRAVMGAADTDSLKKEVI
ncbi:MAG TPA: hypothetical protein QGG47_06530 [Acidobacteriota bacterium]|nr:hypothetical protein [Acidobacteriota bacterium]